MKKGNNDFVVTESHRKYDIRCNPVQLSSSEIGSLGAEEMNKKSASCKLQRQKKILMASNVAKENILKRKRKYTGMLQQDTRAKLMKQLKKNIKAENTKQHQERWNTCNIHPENSKQHQKRRKMKREKSFNEVQGMSSVTY